MPSQRTVAFLAHAVFWFPVAAQAQDVIQGEEDLLHSAPLPYPAEALEKRITGTVTAQATLNERGVVIDAQVVSGPGIFRRVALKSILDWHYAPGTLSPVRVVVDFKLPVKKGPVLLNGQPVAIAVKGPAPAVPKEPPKLDAGIIGRIRFVGVTSPIEEIVSNRLPVHEDDVFQIDTISRIQGILREIDEHLKADFGLLDFDGERRYFELRISYGVSDPSAPGAR